METLLSKTNDTSQQQAYIKHKDKTCMAVTCWSYLWNFTSSKIHFRNNLCLHLISFIL